MPSSPSCARKALFLSLAIVLVASIDFILLSRAAAIIA